MSLNVSQWHKVKQSGSFNRKRQKIYSEMSKNIISDIFKKNKIQQPVASTVTTVNHCNKLSFSTDLSKILASNAGNSLDAIPENVTDSELIVGQETFSDPSENDSDDEQLSKNEQIVQKLKNWSSTFNVRQTALKELLKIFNFMEPGLLPADPRTLLETPKVIVVKKIGELGKYWHQGLFTCLQQTLSRTNEQTTYSLNINTDGLPIANSSKEEFWPILCNIYELPNSKPMVVGIYHGVGKPNLDEYLNQFVEELKIGMRDGIYLNGHLCHLKVRAFICDSPARAFIKGTAYYNSQNGCLKCITVGEYSYESRTNIFPRTGCPKRTDFDFRNKTNELHHKRTSPLEQLEIDMVEDFPVSDSLHLLDLGIMKRLLFGWRDGTFNKRGKWSAKDVLNISMNLSKCTLPREIHRSVRSLECLAHWKGTEFRSFFYYIGIVILKNYLPVDMYAHFLQLFCAITICSSTHYIKYIDVAAKLMESYVERYRDIFGQEFLTSNVHNLLHLVDEVKKFGVLSTFNAYPFENMLYQIKLLLRQGNCPLAQVAKRIHEINQCKLDIKLRNKENFPILKAPTNNRSDYSKLHISDSFLLSKDFANRWFLTKKNELIQFNNAFKGNDEIFYISGQKMQNLDSFFEKPFKSSFINIFECCLYDVDAERKIYQLSDIKCKMVAIVYDDTTTVFVPLIHTLL